MVCSSNWWFCGAGFVTVVLLVAGQLPHLLACDCLGPHHAQEFFCYSDYVLQVQILDKSVEDKLLVYTVDIINEFKLMPLAREALVDRKIYTTANSCGTDFPINSELVITGHVSDDSKAFINLCDFQINSSELTVEQIQGFSGVYTKGCICKTTFCYNYTDNHICTSRTANECVWSLDTFAAQTANETCLPTLESHQCFWTKNRHCSEPQFNYK